MAALYEPHMAYINPCKHVREWKRLVVGTGGDVYENTPAVDISSAGDAIKIVTPRGTVMADKVVLATNAFTHLLPGDIGRQLRRDQAPLFPQITITEPLTEQQLDDLGWKRRNAVEGTLNLYHGFNLYKDRLLMCFQHYFGAWLGAGDEQRFPRQDHGRHMAAFQTSLSLFERCQKKRNLGAAPFRARLI